jgi:putative transposase
VTQPKTPHEHYSRSRIVTKCRDTDYIDFLIGSPKLFSCTEAAKVQPKGPNPPAHDAFTRLLLRLEPDPETLWLES